MLTAMIFVAAPPSGQYMKERSTLVSGRMAAPSAAAGRANASMLASSETFSRSDGFCVFVVARYQNFVFLTTFQSLCGCFYEMNK